MLMSAPSATVDVLKFVPTPLDPMYVVAGLGSDWLLMVALVKVY